jgi:hypothetical protein
LRPGREYIKVKKSGSVFSSIPGEGGSCSSETKHDRRTAPRPKKFFVSKRRLQKKGHNPEKLLDSSPDENVFSSSETKHDRRTA